MAVRIGTAGWSIARDVAGRFPAEGSALERYARVFGAVEINSSFHRPHRASTWQRWGESVPADFRFAVKLPPKLAFDAVRAEGFFDLLGGHCAAAIALEPRNASWFTDEADALLREAGVARVAADPALSAAAAEPGGARTLSYWRLHGSPLMYRSSYGERIADYANRLRADGARHIWCMFDNTASSAATGDALALKDLLEAEAVPRPCADPTQG